VTGAAANKATGESLVLPSYIALAVIGLALGAVMREIRFDDPFITYRFSNNLANGLGFTFNPGAAENALITTAPLYALLLAVPGALGLDIPATSYVIGVLSLIAASWAVYRLGQQHNHASVGFVAALFLLIFPLMWLTMGFETPLFIACALWAFVCVDTKRVVYSGILGGICLGLRGDGMIVVGLLVIGCWLFVNQQPITNCQLPISNLKSPLKLLAIALLVYAPLALFLTLQFGSPIPTTLQTKSAQAAAGLTGFYPGTTYPEGALLLLQALAQQSPLFVFVPIAIGLGIYRFVQLSVAAAQAQGWRWAPHVPFVLPVAWAVLHFGGYTVIGVAPYVWYYAPMLPGVVCLMALGVDWVGAQFSRRGIADQVLITLVVLPLLIGDLNIIRVLQGATPPDPSQLASKLLPETKVNIYRRAGEWLNANTPSDATVGVTELGVMGFFAQRRINDFLGLTQPSHLSAIRHGDFVGGLIRNQPDYLALTNINSLYDANPQEDNWFRAVYTPVATLEDARFWGSPMTIWQRTSQPVTPAIIIDEGVHDLGNGWQVTGVAVSAREVVTSTPLIVSVRLKAGEPRGNRELRVQPIAVQRGDGLPVRSRVIHTDQFRPGEEAWYDFPIMPYPDSRPGAYDISVQWLDGGPEVIAGRIKVPIRVSENAYAQVVPLSSGIAVELLTEPITGCIGATNTVTVTWRGGDPTGVDYSAFVHLRAATGATVAQHDGQPRNGSYPVSVWASDEAVPDPHAIAIGPDITPGEYAIVVGLYNPADNARLPVDASPARTDDDAVKIGEMTLALCEPQ
jgi:hypothetical protein